MEKVESSEQAHEARIRIYIKENPLKLHSN